FLSTMRRVLCVQTKFLAELNYYGLFILISFSLFLLLALFNFGLYFWMELALRSLCCIFSTFFLMYFVQYFRTEIAQTYQYCQKDYHQHQYTKFHSNKYPVQIRNKKEP